jgi:hypothetical protein
MENYITRDFYKSIDTITLTSIEKLSSNLNQEQGIEGFRVSNDGIYIEYNSYIYTRTGILNFLSNLGFRLKKNRKTSIIKRQIEAIARSNYKQYGNRKLDCC